MAKAEIARQVNQIIERRRLTQADAADALGIDQPKVSALSRGRLSQFSLERMMQFASRLGNEVEISIKPSEHAGIKVAASCIPEKHVLSNMIVGSQDVELSLNLDEQHFRRGSSIRMDNSGMLHIEDGVGELVAA